jgi:hypothetical protein
LRQIRRGVGTSWWPCPGTLPWPRATCVTVACRSIGSPFSKIVSGQLSVTASGAAYGSGGSICSGCSGDTRRAASRRCNRGRADRSPIPAGRPTRCPRGSRHSRVELTSRGLDAGPVTIAWHLEREGHPAPSTSTIRRVLHAAGLVVPTRASARAARGSGSKRQHPTTCGSPTSPTGGSQTVARSRSSAGSMTFPRICWAAPRSLGSAATTWWPGSARRARRTARSTRPASPAAATASSSCSPTSASARRTAHPDMRRRRARSSAPTRP